MPNMIKVSVLRRFQSGDYVNMSMGEYAALPLEFFDGFEKICHYSSQKVSELLEDVRENGVQVPLITDGFRMINGHHRFWCAAQLGLEEVPVVECGLLESGEEEYSGEDW